MTTIVMRCLHDRLPRDVSSDTFNTPYSGEQVIFLTCRECSSAARIIRDARGIPASLTDYEAIMDAMTPDRTRAKGEADRV